MVDDRVQTLSEQMQALTEDNMRLREENENVLAQFKYQDQTKERYRIALVQAQFALERCKDGLAVGFKGIDKTIISNALYMVEKALGEEEKR